MIKYGLYVYCRRGGVSQDAGLHASCEAKDIQEARRELLPKLDWLRQFYDEVSWKVKEIDD